jgi:hypothetical protein
MITDRHLEAMEKPKDENEQPEEIRSKQRESLPMGE